MDILKQLRMKFAGIGEEEERRIPPQKTQPFKETKRVPSWLERQFIRTMSRDYDSSDSVDYPAAVAAAVFAVTSIQDKSNYDHRRKISEDKSYKEHTRTNRRGDDKPLTRIKSKAADDIAKKTEKFSDEPSKPTPTGPQRSLSRRTTTMKPEPVKPVPSIKKTPTFGDEKTEGEASEKANGAAPSFKKKSSFSDQKTDTAVPKIPVRDPVVPPTTVPSAIMPGHRNSKADIWEKEQMEKIRQRHKKLINEIIEWETKKKKKARREMERIEVESILNFNEAELARHRAKAMRHFNNEVRRIESIAGGAKAQAEQNRAKEELKVMEKANKIRTTGKMPSTCLCF